MDVPYLFAVQAELFSEIAVDEEAFHLGDGGGKLGDIDVTVLSRKIDVNLGNLPFRELGEVRDLGARLKPSVPDRDELVELFEGERCVVVRVEFVEVRCNEEKNMRFFAVLLVEKKERRTYLSIRPGGGCRGRVVFR